MRRFLSVVVAAWVAAAGLLAAARPAAPAAAPPARIVAVGDIHGDLDAFKGILQRAALLDAEGRWSGGAATLVQVGDMIDRGPKSRGVLDFLMALQKSAPRQGGRVIVLLGNHEAMNIYGDLRFVTPGDYASYTDAKSEDRRAAAYRDYAQLYGGDPPESKTDWMAAHPPGFVEQRAAFGPDGTYGKWLRQLPAVVKVGDSVFLHGGIGSELATWSIDKINQGVSHEIDRFDREKQELVDRHLALPFYTVYELVAVATAAAERHLDVATDLPSFDDWLLTVSPNGPLWFRGYAEWPDPVAGPLVDQVLGTEHAARIVVGHTTLPGTIKARFDGKLYLIDTGMLHGYIEGGRPSALQIEGSHVRAIYPDATEVLK
jgi:Calcineurin-like phosphoesterase